MKDHPHEAADLEAGIGSVRSASPALHATLALLALLVVTILAVYKPRGMTPYGWEKERQMRPVKGRPGP